MSPFRLSPGRLAYLLYYQPRTWWQDRIDSAAGRRGEAAMRAAAASLTPPALATWALSGPAVRFLTGERFVHQTIFCARSFEWACGTHVRLEIFSDGTLRPPQIAQLRQALPHVTIVDSDATAIQLDQVLGKDRFPLLRKMREENPLMRKLLDLHAGRAGPSLYLDSDMLFFGVPAVLRAWLRAPSGEFFMQQDSDALVGDRARLSARLGVEILPGVNSGILALDDDGFDWPGLERAAARLSAGERAHRWAEQTLFAVHVSRRSASPLSRLDYALCNSREDLTPQPPPLRHYVHKSKALYAAGEWQRWLDLSQSQPAGPA
jgi:hypothetical protein